MPRHYHRGMVERERSQVVVVLGEGAEGQRLREAIDRAAAAAGKPVSTWARELLLREIQEDVADPIADVKMNGNESTMIALHAIDAMQSGWTTHARAFISGAWHELRTNKPDDLIARWKRVRRAR